MDRTPAAEADGGSGEPGAATEGPELDLSGAPDPEPSAPRTPRRPRRGWLRLVALAVVGLLLVAGVLAYRRYQERRIVSLSLARARQLIEADTWLGYDEAAALLDVRATQIDPIEAGALRGLALALLALDYRDESAAAKATQVLLEPGRAAAVPPAAQLATAALALGDGRAGTAMEYLSRASEAPLSQVLAARVALMAGNTAMANEAVDRALALEPRLPAALALKGDLLRRAARSREARDAYAAALNASAGALHAGLEGSAARAGAVAPHARAALGLGKLALGREAPETEAAAALIKLVDDPQGTPQVERARAAMQLSALQARTGDRAGAAATLDKVGLRGELRGWLERASAQLEVAKGRYRVPDATPAPLLSASDDDPYLAPPPPPKVEPAPPKPVLHGFQVHPAAAKAPKKKASKATPAKAKPAAKSGKPAATKKKPTAAP